MSNDANAGAAALTLVESILIHMRETKMLDAEGRDQVFEAAINAHEEAQKTDKTSPHAAVARLLRKLQANADGVQVVGELPTGGSLGAASPREGRPE
jgi:hypothetical protein